MPLEFGAPEGVRVSLVMFKVSLSRALWLFRRTLRARSSPSKTCSHLLGALMEILSIERRSHVKQEKAQYLGILKQSRVHCPSTFLRRPYTVEAKPETSFPCSVVCPANGAENCRALFQKFTRPQVKVV